MTTAVDVLRDGVMLTGKVAVIGGGLVGIEALLHIEETAQEILCVEMMDDILKTATHLFNNNQSLRDRMARSSCKMHLSTKVVSVDEQGLVCSKDGEKFRIDCDTVVLAIGLRSNNELEDQGKSLAHHRRCCQGARTGIQCREPGIPYGPCSGLSQNTEKRGNCKWVQKPENCTTAGSFCSPAA